MPRYLNLKLNRYQPVLTMKTILLSVASLSVLSVSLIHAAPAPGPLADFRGHYIGKTTLTATGGSYSGPAILDFTGPNSGRLGTLTAKGNVDAMGVSLGLRQVLRLSKNRFVLSKLAPGVVETPSPTGRVFVSKRTIRGNATAVIPNVDVKMKVTLVKTRRRAKLVLTESVYSGGTLAIEYNYTGRARLRPTD